MSGTNNVCELGDILLAKQLNSDDDVPLAWSGSPLDCLHCNRQLTHPMTLTKCRHVFCRSCIDVVPGGGNNAEKCTIRCELCGQTSEMTSDSLDGSSSGDTLVKYLLTSTNAKTETCANCDKATDPMYYCETCQQTLCIDCKLGTHAARMFSSHKVVPAADRMTTEGDEPNNICREHQQPYILYSTDARRLLCINCFRGASLEARQHTVDLHVGHERTCAKIGRGANKLRLAQQELSDRVKMHKRMLTELNASVALSRTQIMSLCQQMIDALLQTRDRLITQLDTESAGKETWLKTQLRSMVAQLPTINLYLLAASVTVSTAEPIPLLTMAPDLHKRTSQLLSEIQAMQLEKLDGDIVIEIEEKRAYATALEPHLGISSLLLPTGMFMDTLTGTDGSGGSGRTRGNGYRRRSNMSKYQLMVDLAGEFGVEFAKIDTRYESSHKEVKKLCKLVHDVQRDLTIRRCIVDDDKISTLRTRYTTLGEEVMALSMTINASTPNMQQLWQEQLDRVRRQQQIFRLRVEQCVQLREDLRQVTGACEQLSPFVAALSATATTIDTRRAPAREPVAPMDCIRLQIETIQPDSGARVSAIDLQEKERRERNERDREEPTVHLRMAKKSLKTTASPSISVNGSGGSRRKTIAMSDRERSPGGTDHMLVKTRLFHGTDPRRHSQHADHANTLPLMTSLDGDMIETASITSSLEDTLEHRLSQQCTMAPSSTSSSRTASRIGEKDVKSAIEEVTVESTDEGTVSETAIPVAIIHPNNQRQLSSSLPKESSIPNDIELPRPTSTCSSIPPAPPPPPPINEVVATGVPVKHATVIVPSPTSTMAQSMPKSASTLGTSGISAGLWRAYRPGVTIDDQTLNAREIMLQSLKARVPRIDTRTPERDIVHDEDVERADHNNI